MPPHLFRGVMVSWRPCPGVTETSSGACHPGAGRVPWPCACSSGGVPCSTDTASKSAVVDDGQHRSCASHRRSVAHTTCTESADARGECRLALVWCSQGSHRLDTAPRRANASAERSQNMGVVDARLHVYHGAQYRPWRQLQQVLEHGGRPNEQEFCQLPGIYIEPNLIGLAAVQKRKSIRPLLHGEIFPSAPRRSAIGSPSTGLPSVLNTNDPSGRRRARHRAHRTGPWSPGVYGRG